MATEVTAEITGKIWKIAAAIGDRIERGQVLIIMESMKMEIPVESPSAGVVASITVKEGDAVEEGTVLLTLS